MTRQELAAKLNGREYREEITLAEENEARQDGLVVIFGASDDLCELRGAIHDEVGAWQGAEIAIADGDLVPTVEADEVGILAKHGVLEAAKRRRAKAIVVTAEWCQSTGYSWMFYADVPHYSQFDIMEDGERYCCGLVLDLKELEQK